MVTPLTFDSAAATDLLNAARRARDSAYSPYSRFAVGAAVLASRDRVFTGCNVENASFGLTCCAERVAIFKAVSEGARDFVALAVMGPEEGTPCVPCGACRQVMHEFSPDMVVVTHVAPSAISLHSLGKLLPRAFGPEKLPE